MQSFGPWMRLRGSLHVSVGGDMILKIRAQTDLSHMAHIG